MKICFISHSFLPTIGGAELVVHHLSNSLMNMGHEVFVLTHGKKTKKNMGSSYKILFYPRPPKEIFQAQVLAFYLYLFYRKYGFDVIHIHVAKNCHYLLKIKNMLKVPIVITTHGGDIQKYPEINYGMRLDPVLNRNIEFSIKHADLLTAIGSSTHRDYTKLGVPESKIADIPNGVNLKRFNHDSFNIRSKLGLSRDVKLILSVGRYHPKKGYEYLIKALPEIVKQHSDVRCLLVGKRLKVVKPLISDLPLENVVIFLGEQGIKEKNVSEKIDIDCIPNDVLLAAYKSSDIYVSSSLIEGFALTVIEAMAAGLPLVATDVPGNEDAVVEGANGFLTPPKSPTLLADKINRLLVDNELRSKMGSISKKMVQQYEWPKIAAGYHREYKKLTSLRDKND